MDTSTVVATTDTLGRRIAARRHGVNANLVFCWRRLHQQGLLETHTRRMSGRKLIPVKILTDAATASGPAAALRVELPSGVQLHIGSGADLALLERVIELLRR